MRKIYLLAACAILLSACAIKPADETMEGTEGEPAVSVTTPDATPEATPPAPPPAEPGVSVSDDGGSVNVTDGEMKVNTDTGSVDVGGVSVDF